MNLIGHKCNIISRFDGILSSPVYRFVETMTFHDTSRALVAKVEFLREQEKSMMGKMFGGKAPTPEFNKVVININKREPGKEVLVATGGGNWCRYITFDNKLYWQWRDPVPTVQFEPEGKPLASSSVRRPELALISQKKYQEADK